MSKRTFPWLLVAVMSAFAAFSIAPAARADEDELDAPTNEDPEPEVAVEESEPLEDTQATSESLEETQPIEGTQADAERVWDRLLSATIIAGIDTPFGIGGATLEITPFRFLSVYVGGGVGRDSYRFAGGLRAQFPVGSAAVGVMAGVTGGPLNWDSRYGGELSVHRWWDIAAFFHTGLTFEYRWPDGIFGRLAFGAEALIAPEASECVLGDGSACGELSNQNLSHPVRGWAGLQVGYAFAL
jgi:hypothetical protein